ncbi:MAG TPA: T9SS type A sorting domain-containing protein [Ignavibacteriaceae bacterium]|nr:T9SS type A sorting domain-containing protein [Ignavibacteriaceae bacterium]
MGENTRGDGNYTIKFGWSTSLEDSAFTTNRGTYSKIFRLSDTTEAGSGSYKRGSEGFYMYTVQRGGINLLDTFVVGYFAGLTDIDENQLGIPAEFKLSQNYPNPFNPSTKIRYEIPTESKVLIKIYDILGREVAMLINDFQKAGRYQVEWNAGNLASGVYFYSIKAGDFHSVKKLMLLK